MSLVVEQIIYSSFERVGTKIIASADVPLSIQQAFSQKIVSRLWNADKPPEKARKGVYVYQIDRERILFGWLTHDGRDGPEKDGEPYFHCYYLAGTLDSKQLVKMLACLETGPVERIFGEKPGNLTGELEIPDDYRSNAPGMGMRLSREIRLFSHRQLRSRKPLRWYVSARETDLPPTTVPVESQDTSLARIGSSSITAFPGSEIQRVLLDLMAKPIAIEGLVLVSPEGQPLTPALGIAENSSLLLAGTMLYLANNTRSELAWDRVEQIVLRSPQGNLILTACTAGAYLLVKTGKVLSGLLEGEIQKTRGRLHALLENPDSPHGSFPWKSHPESSTVPPFDTIFYGFDSPSDESDPYRP
jgi:predicted regulator of Ras-like GTPase activity (Roadblock/LC7/MglB family)